MSYWQANKAPAKLSYFFINKRSSPFKKTKTDVYKRQPTCFVETKGEYSGLFKKYRLGRGFTNYLLDDNGVIIAKNISAAELSACLLYTSRCV